MLAENAMKNLKPLSKYSFLKANNSVVKWTGILTYFCSKKILS
jgi:hypothetical protein